MKITAPPNEWRNIPLKDKARVVCLSLRRGWLHVLLWCPRKKFSVGYAAANILARDFVEKIETALKKFSPNKSDRVHIRSP